MKSIIEFSANLWESIKNFEDVFGVKTMKIEGKIEICLGINFYER